MSLAALAQHLRDSRDAIVAQWKQVVCGDPARFPAAQQLGQSDLTDHLPPLIEQIALALEGRETLGVETQAREHGHQRRGHGYDIAEVLREHSVLRQTLLDRIHGGSGGMPRLTPEEVAAARARLLDVIDRSGQAAASQFHLEAIAELRAMEEALQAADRQKDLFLSMLSHELRTPLSSILAAAQMLDVMELDDPRLRRAREVIERQVRHQTRLIDDLLDVNRIAQGKLDLRLEEHDLKVVVANAVESCLAVVEAKQQTLDVDLPPEPLPVRGDADRLEQVVTNLLTNANRYTDPGGRIWLSARRDGGTAVLRVRDTGMGIPPEMLARIFDLFAQAETADRGAGGLGIGLALVKRLVELHAGTIEARSEGLDEGSEFVIRLPLAAGASRR